MTFYASPAFQRAPKGELLVLSGCNGKTWGGTVSGVDHHEVLMAPLNVFMKLNASNGIPVLPEYAFVLCELGSWPFPSTMDINILPEACLAYDTLAESENQLEEPASAPPPVTNSGTSKKCKRKGKGQSKSVGATSSAFEVSPGRKNQTSHSDATLASQVAQELQLLSEGSDSDDLTKIQQGTLAISDSQPLVGSTRPESGTNLPGTSVPDLDTPIAPHEDEKTEGAAQPPEASTPVPKPVVPNSTEGIEAQPVATLTPSVVDPTSIPASIGTTAPPRFPQQPITASTSQVPPVPPDTALGQEAGLPAQIANRSMTYLAQSLTVSSAGGNPDIGTFSGVMTTLKKACGLMLEGFREACLDVEVVVQTTLAEATSHDQAFAAKATKDLDLWTSDLQPLFNTDAVPETEMETRRAHARSTGQVVSDRILAWSREVAKDKFPDGGPIWTALLWSFAKVEERCMLTLKKVADQVPEIMAQHVPEGQVGVFLAALYQLICTQQQGITLMVVTQAGVPIHLGVNNWATTASMTWLITQPIYSSAGADRIHTHSPKGCMMVPTSSFPREQVREEGTTTRPIYLGNEADSGISSMGQSTPVKTPVKGSGSHRQPLTSTPKLKPKLLVVAQQHRDELAAKQTGAPHGAHIWPTVLQTARTRPPGPELHSWKQNANLGRTGNSSFVSVNEHSEFTMAALMRRDAPHWIDPDEDVVSIHDSSDIEMVSNHEYDQETEDSSPDSGAEDSHHPSDGSDMESDQDQGSGCHSDLNSEQGSDLGSAPGSDADLGSDNGGDPESSDDNGGDFSDMFMAKKECPGSSKRPQSWPSSNSHSRSRETENQK